MSYWPHSPWRYKHYNKHIASIREKEADILSLYGKLGLKTIPIALAKGTLDKDKGNTLQTLLESAAKG